MKDDGVFKHSVYLRVLLCGVIKFYELKLLLLLLLFVASVVKIPRVKSYKNLKTK